MDSRPFNVLSLFSGIAGLDLGLRLALPRARVVCYVENDIYACAVLEKRIEEKTLDDAPIWSDIRTFDGRPWRERVHCIIGGFPCQDISTAGRRAGIRGERSGLWFEMLRIICEVRPEYVFVENVPALLIRGIDIVLGTLAEAGYDAVWDCFSASDLGAPHKRERVFILAHASGVGRGGRGIGQGESDRAQSEMEAEGRCGQLANTDSGPPRAGEQGIEGCPRERGDRPANDGTELGDPDSSGLEGRRLRAGDMGGEGRELPPWPPGPSEYNRWAAIISRWPELAPAVANTSRRGPEVEGNGEHDKGQDGTGEADRAGSDGPICGPETKAEAEPDVRDLADGVSRAVGGSRTDQLRALGNAVVPVVAAKAFITLARKFGWIISR